MGIGRSPGDEGPHKHRRSGRLRFIPAAAGPGKVRRCSPTRGNKGNRHAQHGTRSIAQGQYAWYLACITKTRGMAGEFIRFEPMVWVGSAVRKVWKERPLPIAVFAQGSAARVAAISALQRASIKYRMSYESPSLLGLISMVEAGLAVASLAKCSVPGHLVSAIAERRVATACRTRDSPCTQFAIRASSL